jgi:uncharacterized protein YcgI (DUF1989 family)
MSTPLKVPGRVVSDEILPARAYWHNRLIKGDVLRIVDLEGCQAVDTIVYVSNENCGRTLADLLWDHVSSNLLSLLLSLRPARSLNDSRWRRRSSLVRDVQSRRLTGFHCLAGG